MSQIKTKFIENLAVTNAKVATGIDATKLADGSVTNTELQYINSVTSDVQTQINGKQSTGSYITALTGDVTAAGPGSAAATIAAAAVTNSKVATGIDAVKLADGSVTNTEFQYINSLTSNAQTQISGKANQALDNLASTAINTDLLTDTTLTYSLGNPTFEFSSVHTPSITSTTSIGIEANSGNVEVDANGGDIILSALDTYGVNVISGDNTTETPLRLFQKNGVYSVAMKAPTTLAASYTLTMPVDDGTSSQVLTTNGTGTLSWTTPGGSGANTALSNLTVTAINADLLFDDDDTYAIGSNSNRVYKAYIHVLRDSTDVDAIDIQSRLLNDSSGGNAVDFSGTAATKFYKQLIPDAPGSAAIGDTTNYFSGVTSLGVSIVDDSLTYTTSIQTTTQAANLDFILPPDAGTSGYVLQTDGAGVTTWVAASSGSTVTKETFTLSAGDITAQKVTVANTPIAYSATFIVKGGAPTLEGASYDYSVTGSDFNFLNDLATGGPAALVAGDVVQIQYSY